jgi:hypothetical protein
MGHGAGRTNMPVSMSYIALASLLEAVIAATPYRFLFQAKAGTYLEYCV